SASKRSMRSSFPRLLVIPMHAATNQVRTTLQWSQVSRAFEGGERGRQCRALDLTRRMSSPNAPAPLKIPASSLTVADFVVAAAQELDQTNAVTEGIGQMRDAAPIMRLDLPLDRGAGCNCLAHGSIEFGDDEIKMHWCPMSSIATHLVGTCGRPGAVRFHEQV